MEPEGSPQLFLYKDSAKLWRSGHWNGNRWSGIPAMHRNNIFDVVFVNNQDEITVRWTVQDPSLLTFVKIDGSGSIEQFTWQQQQRKWIEIYSAPVDPCDYYGKCGVFGSCNPFDVSGYECYCLPGYEPKSPNDWALRDGSQGCRKKQDISMCRNGEGFVKVGDIKLPDTSNVHVDLSLSLEECREECLRNCSCLAFANADVRDGGSGCLAWYGSLVDIKQFTEGGQDLFVRVDEHELEKSKGLPTKWMLVILVVSIAVASLTIGSVLYWFRRRKRKGKGQSVRPNVVAVSSQGFEKCQRDVDECRGNTDTTFFDLSTIIVATNNFLSSNMLGQGGFGSVYKGTLADGQEIAVKRLSRNSGQGIEEFKNEVKLIAKLQHRNLVRLLGCCIHQEEKMLIYEYMPNKSLDLLIFDQNRRSMLDWGRRFQIIFGIARGILYLHQDSRLKIIHRDLKASNVLLDATMNPKISDFGMARMFGDDQVEANTNRIVGTYGYMSPEYAMEGLYSIKSDVFSFGVLTLEIVSGKKNSNFNEVSSLNLIGQIWDMWVEGKVLDLVDPSLGQSYPTQEVLKCIQIGLLCVQEIATDRPTMLDVVFMLGNETALPSPSRPAFIFRNANSAPDSSTSRGASVNDITVTIIEAR